MPIPDLSDTRLRLMVMAAAALVGVVLFILLPFVTDVGFVTSSALLALPIVALGAMATVSSREWIILIASIAVSAVSYFISVEAFIAALLLCFGSAGISDSSDIVSRRFLPRMLRTVEHAGGGLSRKFIMVLLGIPFGMDTRDMRMNGTVIRESIPWKLRISVLVAITAPTLLIWIAVACSGAAGCIVPVMVVSLYAICAAVPLSVLETAEVRICSGQSETGLFSGFRTMATVFSIPLVIALVLVCIIEPVDIGSLELIFVSIVFDVIAVMLTMIRFQSSKESEIVREMAEDWSSDHPVLLLSGFDGRLARHGADDGVPGTPKRSEDSLFRGNGR